VRVNELPYPVTLSASEGSKNDIPRGVYPERNRILRCAQNDRAKDQNDKTQFIDVHRRCTESVTSLMTLEVGVLVRFIRFFNFVHLRQFADSGGEDDERADNYIAYALIDEYVFDRRHDTAQNAADKRADCGRHGD